MNHSIIWSLTEENQIHSYWRQRSNQDISLQTILIRFRLQTVGSKYLKLFINMYCASRFHKVLLLILKFIAKSKDFKTRYITYILNYDVIGNQTML